MQIRHMAPCALTTMTMLMRIKIVGDYAENNTVGDDEGESRKRTTTRIEVRRCIC